MSNNNAPFNDLNFLQEGEWTRSTDVVRELAVSIVNFPPRKTVLGSISHYVFKLNFDKSRFNEEYRKRTASDIIESGYVTGCTDSALIFIALARTLGIRTRYVETFEKVWLDDPEPDGLSNHVFVDVNIDSEWRVYDPVNGFTPDNKYVLNRGEYTLVGKGLDFSQIFLLENGIYRSDPVDLQYFNEAFKIFKPELLQFAPYEPFLK